MITTFKVKMALNSLVWAIVFGFILKEWWVGLLVMPINFIIDDTMYIYAKGQPPE